MKLQHIAADAKRTMVRYIAHEIRSPLNVVNAGLALTYNDVSDNLKESDMKKEIVENVRDAQHASKSAISILDDLLSFESMDAGNS